MKRFLQIAAILLCVASPISAQEPICFSDDNSPATTVCAYVDTTAGRLTAAHCNLDGATNIDPTLDFAFDSRITGSTKTSAEQPRFFVDRRGVEHEVNVVRTDDRHWYCDITFFPGESGSPLFDGNKRCCGIVLGNTRFRRWRGRVLRLSFAATRSRSFFIDK